MATSRSRIYLTLKYMFHIRGHYSIPDKSFPYRMGCHNSDMFRISIDDDSSEYFSDGISLSEYHAAFLCSPIFQIELWLLTKLGIASNIDPITTTKQHLQGVATGDHSSFGPWTTWAVTGNRSQPIASVPSSAAATPSESVTPCVIMRCRTSRGPFCDTWWAIELDNTPNQEQSQPQRSTGRRPQLVFGTSLLKEYHNSILMRLMTPFHRLYSRLLLANCKSTLVFQYQKHQRK